MNSSSTFFFTNHERKARFFSSRGLLDCRVTKRSSRSCLIWYFSRRCSLAAFFCAKYPIVVVAAGSSFLALVAKEDVRSRVGAAQCQTVVGECLLFSLLAFTVARNDDVTVDVDVTVDAQRRFAKVTARGRVPIPRRTVADNILMVGVVQCSAVQCSV